MSTIDPNFALQTHVRIARVLLNEYRRSPAIQTHLDPQEYVVRVVSHLGEKALPTFDPARGDYGAHCYSIAKNYHVDLKRACGSQKRFHYRVYAELKTPTGSDIPPNWEPRATNVDPTAERDARVFWDNLRFDLRQTLLKAMAGEKVSISDRDKRRLRAHLEAYPVDFSSLGAFLVPHA